MQSLRQGRTARNATVRPVGIRWIIEDDDDDRGGGGIEANAFVKLIKEAKPNNYLVSPES